MTSLEDIELLDVEEPQEGFPCRLGWDITCCDFLHSFASIRLNGVSKVIGLLSHFLVTMSVAGIFLI
jgi:hypothetical protein